MLDNLISRRIFNLVMGLVIVYGFAVSSIVSLSIPPEYLITHKVSSIVVFFLVSIVGVVITNLVKNPAWKIIGFTLVSAPFGIIFGMIGLVVSVGVIYKAMVMTLAIALVSAVVGSIYPNAFASMGRALSISLLTLIVIQVINMVFGLGLGGILATISAFIFSLFIAHDYVISQRIKPTFNSAIECGSGLFLNIANLFIDLVSQLGGD